MGDTESRKLVLESARLIKESKPAFTLQQNFAVVDSLESILKKTREIALRHHRMENQTPSDAFHVTGGECESTDGCFTHVLESDDLPDLPAGLIWNEQPSGRTGGVPGKWQRVDVVTGTIDGRWAYWKNWWGPDGHPGIGDHPQFWAIADRLFNENAVHFIGMLAKPYTGKGLYWVLISPKMTPPRSEVEIEETAGTRYERSKEVFDVETQSILALGQPERKL